MSSGKSLRLIQPKVILINIEIAFRLKLTNTQIAPLAILSAIDRSQNRLEPLQEVQIPMRNQ